MLKKIVAFLIEKMVKLQTHEQTLSQKVFQPIVRPKLFSYLVDDKTSRYDTSEHLRFNLHKVSAKENRKRHPRVSSYTILLIGGRQSFPFIPEIDI